VGLTNVLGWCRKHRVLATTIGIVAFYFIGYRFYYCVNEGCTHPADWWFHLGAEGQAAWVGSLGTLVAVWWGFVLFWQERREKRELQRKAAQPVAYQLISELEAIERKINNSGIFHPEAAKILAISTRHGKLNFDLLNVVTAFALLRDDEVSALVKLNKSLEDFNGAAQRSGTDMSHAGSTGDDLLFYLKSARGCVVEVLGMLRSRYTNPPAKILEGTGSNVSD